MHREINLYNGAYLLLNQTCAWFLKTDPVRIVGKHACVYPRPRLLITSGMMWHDMDLI